MLANFEHLATGRKTSFLAADMSNRTKELNSVLSNARIAVIGAAGSIGTPVVKTLLQFPIRSLHLFDLSENNLVEVVRDLRSSAHVRIPEEFRANPIGLGSEEFQLYFAANGPFDFVFNLSALKHVRSEKDTYSLSRMIDTNVIHLFDFMKSLSPVTQKIFSVSSDKAVNPGNIMGASKMAMEQVLWAKSGPLKASSARFANVAFSDGSLLFGFLKRFEKRQPIAAPNDVKRFFMSHEEAGQLCVLSGALGDDLEIFLPGHSVGMMEKRFSDIATEFLEYKGFEPYICESEEQAKTQAENLISQKKWPCFFSASNTMGEKQHEEFLGAQENPNQDRFISIDVAMANRCPVDSLSSFVHWFKKNKSNPSLSKDEILERLSTVVVGFKHVSSNRSLDSKM